jgi:glutaredoxin
MRHQYILLTSYFSRLTLLSIVRKQKSVWSKKKHAGIKIRRMSSCAAIILLCATLSLTALSLQTPIHSSDVVPRKFFVEPSNLLNIAASSTSMVTRVGSGAFVDGYTVKIVKETEENAKKYAVLDGEVLKGYRVEETTTSVFDRRPAQMIELYEFEGCPFCRKVREAVAILDLDILFYPCPKGSTIYRPMVEKMGGKAQFPYMKDPNTGVSIYESDDIIQYMFDTYGPVDAKIPAALKGGLLTTLTCGVSLLPRRGRGSTKTESRQPKEPIVYWGYESSPFCKVVREKLVELEIPHIQKTCARGSPKRQDFLDRKGIFQVDIRFLHFLVYG